MAKRAAAKKAPPSPDTTQGAFEGASNSVVIPMELEGAEFMGPEMKAYFRTLIGGMRNDLLSDIEEGARGLRSIKIDGVASEAAERSSAFDAVNENIRATSRQRERLRIMNDALTRLDEDLYGYCEDTGDPIPVKRLLSDPFVKRTVEAQQKHEKIIRGHRLAEGRSANDLDAIYN